ncbi:hypothetical protein AAZX31_01G040400 [Glycine max]
MNIANILKNALPTSTHSCNLFELSVLVQKKGDIAYLYVRVCVYDKRCRLFLIFLIRLLLFIKGLNCVFYFSHCCNGLFIWLISFIWLCRSIFTSCTD